MADLIVDGDLVLYGVVGADPDSGEDGFSARQILEALPEFGGESINVRLNSGGGLVNDGIAIYSALKAYAGVVTVTVDAIAASAASLLAMAGDRIVMRTGAMMMVHNPLAITLGNWADHEQAATWLKKEATRAADIYALRTGKSRDECMALMDAETWLTAEEAVEAGFADEADEAKAVAFAKFDYAGKYRHPPRVLMSGYRGKALFPKTQKDSQMTTKNGEAPVAENPGATAQAVPAAPAVDIEKVKAEATAAAFAASKARMQAIFDHEEAKGREELARHLAFATDLAPEAVAAILAKSPKAEPSKPAGKSPFAAAMDAAGNPQIGPDVKPKEASDLDDFVGAIMADFKKFNSQAKGV